MDPFNKTFAHYLNRRTFKDVLQSTLPTTSHLPLAESSAENPLGTSFPGFKRKRTVIGAGSDAGSTITYADTVE
jgi:hypothetical protein